MGLGDFQLWSLESPSDSQVRTSPVSHEDRTVFLHQPWALGPTIDPGSPKRREWGSSVPVSTQDAITLQPGAFSGELGSRPAATWSWCHNCSARPLSTCATSASPARPSRVRPSASRRPGTLFTRNKGSCQVCRKAVRSRSGTSVCMYWSNLEEG